MRIEALTKAAEHGTTVRFTAVARAADGSIEEAAGLVTVRIYDVAEDKWWDSADAAWEVVAVANAPSEYVAATLDGVYFLDLDLTSLSNTANRDLLVHWLRDDTGDTDLAVVPVRHALTSLPITIPGDDEVANPVATWGDLAYLIKVVLSHNQFLDDAIKRHIFYAEDGATTALEFDTKDAVGLASVREVFQKERV